MHADMSKRTSGWVRDHFPLPAAITHPPGVLETSGHTEFTVEEACLEVRQVHLSVEIQSSYFIFRPLCVAK